MSTALMRSPRWIPLACLAGLLVSCNILNPTGSGDYPDDADAHINLGQRALQRQDFVEADSQFTWALRKDPAKSLAYQGLAKATLGADSFKISELVKMADTISKASDDQKLLTLANKDSTWINRIYRPLMRVEGIYERLTELDTCHPRKTDGLFSSDLVKTELNALRSNMSYFLLIDLANPVRDTVITSRELSALKLLQIGSSSNGLQIAQLDPSKPLSDDSVKAINGLLQNVDAIKSDTALMNKLLGSAATSGSDPTGSISEQAQTFLKDLGSSVSFYQVNDGLDNDGDGCIDEGTTGDATSDIGEDLAGADAFIGPDDLRTRLKLKLDVTTDSLKAVPWAAGDSTWATGRNLDWRSYMDATVDTVAGNGWSNLEVYKAVQAANPDKDAATIKQLTILQIRTRVLAEKSGSKRLALGQAHVGGCWTHEK